MLRNEAPTILIKGRMFALREGGGEHESANRDKFQRVPAAVPDREILWGIFVSTALAKRICLPEMRRSQLLLTARTAGVCLQALPPAEFNHSGNCPAAHPSSTDCLILGVLFGRAG